MSGTSMDAIDAALVDFEDGIRLLASHSEPLPHNLRRDLEALIEPGNNELARLAQLDVQFGRLCAAAVAALLGAEGSAAAVRAIGLHGQTIRHLPEGEFPTTLQIGDPNIVAEQTGIATVADLRRRDIAAGGQGAPLVPAFHAATLHDPTQDRVVVNIGGIANITCLPADTCQAVTGFDTGPGNTLMDIWYRTHNPGACDTDGAWAAGDTPDDSLLQALLADAFFKQAPPTSTGREYFNLSWLQGRLADHSGLPAQRVQATLCELTAVSIAAAIEASTPATREVLICGGGVHNSYLMQRLTTHMPKRNVSSTAQQGVPPDWVEAMAFAWLARQTLQGEPGNLPSVTGAHHPVVLGAIYQGRTKGKGKRGN
ncbi:MAG: anhydro-N-acetylmuramic acid kinase, partial [Pseudomonadota bacterium]